MTPVDELKKLYIEPTSRCNLNCEMCFRKAWQGESFADMDDESCDAIFANLPSSVERVFFGGMGEPLLHRNIISMVQRAARAGKIVEMISNASLLTPEKSRQLLDAGLSSLWISIDSFDAFGYEHIRKNADLSALQQNLDAFNRERWLDGRKTRLCVNFVAMKSNVDQLSLIPHFVKRYDVNEVNVSNMLPSDKASESELLYDRMVDLTLGIPNEKLPTLSLPLMNWEGNDVLKGVGALMASSAVQVHLSGRPMTRQVQHCRFIDEGNAFVRHDGNVSPCMALLHSATTYWLGKERMVRHHSFGNVKTEALSAIWASDAYVRFRSRVRRFDFSPCIRCSGCEDWESNSTDCYGNEKPTCGACLWAEGIISCP